MKSDFRLLGKIKGILFALISSGTFGLIPLFTLPLRQEEGMNEFSIVFHRYVLSAGLIATLCLIDKKSLFISFKSLIRLFFISVFYAATAVGLVYSYNYIPSGIVTTIHFLYPVVVVFLMAFLYKEALSKQLLLIALLAIAGVGFLASSGSSGGQYLQNNTIGTIILGLFLALMTAFTYGFYIVGLNLRGIRELDSKVITFYVLVFGALLYAIFAQFTSGGIQRIPSGSAWLNLSLLALFPTVISLITLMLAVKKVGSTITSILGAAEPIVAVLCGVFVFDEAFTLGSFLGLGLVVTAVTLVMLNMARKRSGKQMDSSSVE